MQKKSSSCGSKETWQSRLKLWREGPSPPCLEAKGATGRNYLGKNNSRLGQPHPAIVETIGREKADAIVVGRRGHGQLSGLLLGSVSQKLCSLAPCVVIMVP